MDLAPKPRSTKAKVKQMELHETKRFLQRNGTYYQNKKATYSIKEDITNHISNKGLKSKV